MTDATGGPGDDVPIPDVSTAAAPSKPRPVGRIVAVILVLALVGGGIGAGFALTSGSSSGANGATQPISNLLNAANHSDALAALDTLVPGERAAIEPGLSGLVSQLSRLNILAPNVDLSDIHGLSLDFRGARLTSASVAPNLAAVYVDGGSVRASVNGKQLPVGSFVADLAGSKLSKLAQSQTSALRSGRTPIVVEKVNGTWYVSLGYTIAVDSLRSEGKSGAPPPASETITPTGASTAIGAVQSMLNDVSTFNLRGLIGDLAPGEMGALQSYAPLFLSKANASLNKERSEVRFQITSSGTSTAEVDGGELVKLGSIGISVTVQGTTIKYSRGCVVIQVGGTNIRRCPTPSQRSAADQQLFAAFPPNVRALLKRLGAAHPAIGIATVESAGRWFVSPTQTVLDDTNAYAAIFQPGDLTMLVQLFRNKAELNKIASAIEKIELGGLTSGRLIV